MTERLRVLQVGTGAVPIPPQGAFGIERAVHTLSTALVDAGLEVTLLDVADARRGPLPYAVQTVDVAPWEEAAGLLPRVSRVARFSFGAAARVRSLYASGAFDVLHCHFQFPGGALLPLARRLAIPAVYSVHNYVWSDLRQYRETRRRVLRRGDARAVLWLEMERIACRAADVVTCQTGPVAANVAAELGLPPEKVTVFPHALSDSWFSACRGDGARRRDTVLSVGRLAPVKNQAVLIRALSLVRTRCPGVRLLIVGPETDEAYADELRRLAAASDVAEAVTFLNGLSDDELRSLYQESALFVLPSLAESSPASLLEAMACRMPVIASDIPTLSWLLPTGTAVLVPPSDPQAWAEAIADLLLDGERRRALGARALEDAYEAHRWGSIVGRLAGIYQEAMERARRRRAAC